MQKLQQCLGAVLPAQGARQRHTLGCHVLVLRKIGVHPADSLFPGHGRIVHQQAVRAMLHQRRNAFKTATDKRRSGREIVKNLGGADQAGEKGVCQHRNADVHLGFELGQLAATHPGMQGQA